MTDKRATTKKQIAQEFLSLTEKGEIEETFDLYVSKDFQSHSPHYKGDRDTAVDMMKKTAKDFPTLESKRHRVLEDGNFVAVYSHIKPLPENSKDAGLAYVHIFRFNKDSIVELWSLGAMVISYLQKRQMNTVCSRLPIVNFAA